MKKNGFTLIELLAVIVILAIIALIATPIVLNVIEDSKLSAARVSANNYVRALDTVLLSNSIYEEEDTRHTCDIVLKNSESYIECDYIEELLLVEVSGNKPSSGIIEVVNNKVVEYEIDIDGKTIYSTEPTSNDCFETSENEDETLTITKYLCGKNDKTKILDVIIPKRINSKKITTIGYEAFANKGLKSVIIPEGVIKINQRSFVNNQLTIISIPNSAIDIVYQSFSNNKLQENGGFIYKRTGKGVDYSTLIAYGGPSGSDVVIPKEQNGVQLKTIGYRAFFYHTVNSIEIPEGVTTISFESFAYSGLKSVKIPSSVNSIANGAFAGNKLTSVIVKGKSSLADFDLVVSNSFGWAEGYSDDNIVFEP